jgi:hypothetical protein
MLFSSWLNSSAMWMGASQSWKTAAHFENNIWIMGCARLPHDWTSPVSYITVGTRHSGWVFFRRTLFLTWEPWEPAWRTMAHSTTSRISSYLMSMLLGRNNIVYKCRPTVHVGFVHLASNGQLFWNRVLKTNIQFCYHLRCSSSVIFRNSPSQCTRTICLPVNVGFRPLFLFADVVFPSFLCVDITLKTVAVDNSVAVFVRDASARRVTTICLVLKSDKSPNPGFPHMDCH